MSVFRVWLDPSFFWISEDADTRRDAGTYLKNIVSILAMNRHKCLKLELHEDSGTALYEKGIVPSERRLKTLFPGGDWEETITIKDMSKSLNELLIKLVSDDVDAPEALVKCNVPIEFLVENTVDLERRRISEESLIQYGFRRCFLGDDAHYLFPRSQMQEVEIRSEICVETADIPDTVIPDGTELGVCVSAFSCDYGLQIRMDEEILWNAQASRDQLKLAIEVVGAKKFGVGSSKENFAFGPKFKSSAQLCGGIDGALKSILIERIVTLIYAPEKAEFSAFRKTKDKNSGIRVRKADEAEAYRMHLTKSNEGFRLMFWRLKDGSIELANVGTKFEEKIM